MALVALRCGPSIVDYLALARPSGRSLALGAGLACALAAFGDTSLSCDDVERQPPKRMGTADAACYQAAP